MKNIKNEVYNALANIMFETGASKEDTVSYTHLDVYKRQLLPTSRSRQDL